MTNMVYDPDPKIRIEHGSWSPEHGFGGFKTFIYIRDLSYDKFNHNE